MTITDRPVDTRADTNRAAPPDPAAARWRQIQRGVAAAVVLLSLAFQLALTHVIPPLVVVMALFAGAGALTARRPRGAGIAVGVLSLLLVLAFLPDIIRDLADPASTLTFFITGAITVAALVGIVGGVALLRRREAARVATLLPPVAVTVVIVLAAVAVFARVTLDSPGPEPGDHTVVAEQVEFAPAGLEAEAGTVAVHVENRDLGAHDFVIDELDVDLHVPARTSRRVEFEATPGTYTAVCTLPGHEDMVVTLTVR